MRRIWVNDTFKRVEFGFKTFKFHCPVLKGKVFYHIWFVVLPYKNCKNKKKTSNLFFEIYPDPKKKT
jgi:hypothetical protein